MSDLGDQRAPVPAPPPHVPEAQPAPLSAAVGPTAPPAGRDWRTLHLWHIQPVRDALIILALLGLLYLGKVLSLVTVPMLLALLLAYLFEPLVKRITRGRIISRPGAALGIIVLAAGLGVLPITLGLGFAVLQGATYTQRIAINAEQLIDVVSNPTDQARRAALPATWQRAADRLVELRQRADRVRALRAHDQQPDAPPPDTTPAVRAPLPTGTFEPLPDVRPASREDVEAAQLYRTIEAVIAWVRANAAAISRQAFATGANAVEFGFRWLFSLVAVIFAGFLTAFFFYFFCTGYGRVLAFWEGLIPERRRGRIVDLAHKMDLVISGFIRGRLTICAILAAYYTIGYWFIGAPVPLILGPLVGALTLIPYAAGLAAPLVVGLMWLEPPDAAWQATWMWMTLAPLGVAVGQQMLDDYFLTPRIQGETTGMDTPTILFASLAGGLLAGVYGLLVAIPVAACVRILMREVVWPQFKAWAEGRADDPLPISRT
ncbi:MAG: AI-2E family transporter [Phycisphaerales bacterium]